MAGLMTRVLVVDDLAPVRDALATFLAETDEVQVVGTAGDGREAVQRARELRPDVVVMDLEMPVMDGYASTRLIVSEGLAAVVVLSIHGGDRCRARALAAGASAFLEKGDAPDQLLQAVRSACHRAA